MQRNVLSRTEAMLTMTGFSATEFNTLWSVVKMHAMSSWNEGRGRRSQTTAKDAFFMLLCVMKHYDTWDKHALDFDIKAPTFEKLIGRIMALVTPVLYEHFFQPANRPSGSFVESKRYFSGKHKLYGYKIEASGVYVDVSDHRPGSVSDLTMFLDRIATHRSALSKSSDEDILVDAAEGRRLHATSWAVLQDKGYEGIDEAIRNILPKKKPRGGHLDHVERHTIFDKVACLCPWLQ
ncbi:hypothetical protein H310_08475 [Aphanomyces invadans]|uniref:DDE Tnp4 domain-containing protein n=1 Tax=Aphanomyces invadans TaxID=157072 RepID=A0A024U085_9STRA|nr:hypothetical protein H310_08475 [Aphanomyces invadans]ETV99002.1 hypothetical protein H310_08475 [Aphanomyces invadans]|eukprot:XP_008872430.1 hypothetical protein H310_08475 [Aphanomyces invadans]